MRGLVISGRRFAFADVILSGAGIVMLVNSLLPWYGYDANGWHPTYDGFQSGFLAFLALVVVVVIAGTSATRAWTGTQLPAVAGTALTWDAVFVIADALALLLVVIFWATLPSLAGVSTGAKVGTFLGMIVILAQGAGAVLALASAGVPLRWRPRRPATS
jgi:hypothetical protein